MLMKQNKQVMGNNVNYRKKVCVFQINDSITDLVSVQYYMYQKERKNSTELFWQ